VVTTTRSDELRRTLSRRVSRRLAGRGIPRQTIDATVDRVVRALEGAAPAAAPAVPAPAVVAAFSARSRPDLASRVRGLLSDAGITAGPFGIASAGRHTVVTASVPAGARAVVERSAASAAVAVSFAASGPGEGA
jgi:hypothetical protein